MGRPRRFDESALLDAALELFWSKGFDRTSVEDVSAAAGVGNGSIYAAYGSKMRLFLTVFDRYCERRTEFVREVILLAPGSVRSAVHTLFKAIIADCASHPDRRGCLMINSIAQFGDRVPEVVALSTRATEQMEAGIADRLRTATGPDIADVDEDRISALSANILLVSQGMIQLSRLGTPVERLHEIAEVFCDALPFPRASMSPVY
ncbi:TetR/AcrR family transcriptional regulator [Streptosporangium subroseum]|uniref:TetR/AcrR family transcriptional regulator n=1 Tax=Streptosporangium subroseum TaxID=106412 RepID=UPI00344A7A37